MRAAQFTGSGEEDVADTERERDLDLDRDLDRDRDRDLRPAVARLRLSKLRRTASMRSR